MIKIKNYFFDLYRQVTGSIAFYPALISIIFLFLAAIAIELRTFGVTEFLLKNAPYLVLSDEDTSRTILSTLIGGLLSLVVFSFSMVMLLLSQASSNYSPRLLPGLISEKKHQIVLGTYLGTIIYCIFILINVKPSADAYQLPGFAILLGIGFGILCMAMFVYFIHSISQEIQISNILLNVFNKAKIRLNLQDENEERHKYPDFPKFQNEQIFHSHVSGYFQGTNSKLLLELSEKHDTKFEILPVKGMFILRGVEAVSSEKELDEEVISEVLSCLHFNHNEHVEGNYVLGFKQITEIAVKAMSPGINDPATAVSAIDYLSELFAMRMKLNDKEYLTDDKGNLRISFNIVQFEELMYHVLTVLRQYSKHDVLVMEKLFVMLKYLLKQPKEKKSYSDVILQNSKILLADAEDAISNKTDLERLRRLANTLKDVKVHSESPVF